ncbi:MAG TPA: 30S ribosomal protein S6 [Candidatus Paceibacterota bacterium]|jgi:ribosomal protein S6|nr:30S ribosomal protein S6 [Candidatus Paceibacterota bacterium]
MSKAENTSDENEIKEDLNGRVYELGYLLVPTLAAENITAVYGDLKDLITSKFKGEIIADDMPKTMTLAYPMLKVVSNVRSKFDNAYFGWVKFTMSPEEILELKKHLDLDINMIRFLLIKTVKENTIATKRFVARGGLKRTFTPRKSDEVTAPINKEEVDKEIDALIAP